MGARNCQESGSDETAGRTDGRTDRRAAGCGAGRVVSLLYLSSSQTSGGTSGVRAALELLSATQGPSVSGLCVWEDG